MQNTTQKLLFLTFAKIKDKWFISIMTGIKLLSICQFSTVMDINFVSDHWCFLTIPHSFNNLEKTNIKKKEVELLTSNQRTKKSHSPFHITQADLQIILSFLKAPFPVLLITLSVRELSRSTLNL